MGKKGTIFCKASEIEKIGTSIFNYLKNRNLLLNLSKSEFVDALVDFYQRTNELHPFREGNGRTQRTFISQLVNNAGYYIDFSAVDPDIFMIATIKAANGTEDLLKSVFREIVYAIK